MSDLVLSVASEEDAADLVEVIHAAFGARRDLDPPSTAIDETTESIAAALRRGGGVFATVDGQPAGAVLISEVAPGLATFQRVSVHPDYQRHGVASAMVAAAQDHAAELGFTDVELFARAEFANLIGFWQHRGFTIQRPEAHGVVLGRALPVAVRVQTGKAMQDLGARLATVLRAGDLIIATGGLGAGKTTLTQGIGRGLHSDGPIISPTFVISRVHTSTDDHPILVHVDAYRLGSAAEIDDLDLDATVEQAVTVVEWGEGIAESLAEHRLEIDIRRDVAGRDTPGAEDTPGAGDLLGASDEEVADPRTLLVRPVGARWAGVDLSFLREVSS